MFEFGFGERESRRGVWHSQSHFGDILGVFGGNWERRGDRVVPAQVLGLSFPGFWGCFSPGFGVALGWIWGLLCPRFWGHSAPSFESFLAQVWCLFQPRFGVVLAQVWGCFNPGLGWF